MSTRASRWTKWRKNQRLEEAIQLGCSEAFEILYWQCLSCGGVRLFQPDAAEDSSFEARSDYLNEDEADNVNEIMDDE